MADSYINWGPIKAQKDADAAEVQRIKDQKVKDDADAKAAAIKAAHDAEVAKMNDAQYQRELEIKRLE